MPRLSTVLPLLVSVLFAPVATSAPLDRSFDPTHPDWLQAEVSPAERMQRAAEIRDTAAAVGMTNAALLAGIAQVETNFAHCWSEATWACQGPASSSCGGGPVIAGSADGACSLQQGGLGLFQFDAGTYSQTIAMYGSDIVTLAGNVEAVVPFLVTRAIESVAGVDTEAEALAWMNSIPVVPGDPLFEDWGYFVSWRYNGCKGCSSQEAKYKDGALLLFDEMGEDFWAVDGPACEPVSAAGRMIDDDDGCLKLGGPAQYWRSASGGMGDGLRWTKATASAEAVSTATWTLRFEQAGNYEVAVNSDGGTFGQTRAAAYQVTHASGADAVIVDQGSAAGWHVLGTFAFEAGVDYTVRLNDNTGEPWEADPGGMKIMVDALEVTPVDGEPQGDGGGSAGGGNGAGGSGEPGAGPGGADGPVATGCSAAGAGGHGPWWMLAFVGIALGRRRKISAE